MPAIAAQRELAAPAQAVWDLIQDFGNILRWWPADGPVRITRVVVEGEGVGATRHIYNEGMSAPVSERLDFLDPERSVWKLSIVGVRPAGILRYAATGMLEECCPDRCRLVYQGEFQAEPGRDVEARQFLNACYALMFDGLEAAAGGGTQR